MELEKIIKFVEKEKDYISGAILYASIKIAECIPTSLHVKKYGTSEENNPLLASMMDTMGIDEGIIINQLLFGSLVFLGTYSMNKQDSFGIKRVGTKVLYAASAIGMSLAVTNWIVYLNG